MRSSITFNIFREVRYYLWVIMGAIVLTLAFFIVLPLMQTISKPPLNRSLFDAGRCGKCGASSAIDAGRRG